MGLLAWTRYTFRELAHLSDQQRRDILESAIEEVYRHRIARALWHTLPFVLATLVMGLVLRYELPMLFIPVVLLATSAWAYRDERRRLRRAMQRYMVRRRIRPAFCFGCGYELIGSGRRLCPECGTRLVEDPPPPHGSSGS